MGGVCACAASAAAAAGSSSSGHSSGSLGSMKVVVLAVWSMKKCCKGAPTA